MTADDSPTHGFCRPPFQAVRALFESNLANGRDLGASLAITVEGETVVDLWGGHKDASRRRPWQHDTLVNVYSSTKTLTALVALVLADRGELDLDAPVASYWPEFAANGKQAVRVRHVLGHSAGLPDWDPPIQVDVLLDWETATARLAAQAPAWPPGTAIGYHALTQGFLIGEVVRRITGRTLGTVFRETIAEPLGADFHIGLPTPEHARVADLVLDPAASADSATGPLDVGLANSTAWRVAEIPAANGHGNARSLAEIHRLLANGGAVGGRRILSEASCRKTLQVEAEGEDRVLGMAMRFGLGFALGNGLMPNPNTLYWGGYGGSLIIVDLDARTTFAYAMNQIVPGIAGDPRGLELAMACWEAMGLI